jgi:hypothetical protein
MNDHQPQTQLSAQIGVVTILLATILLTVAVSVSTRVSDQIVQETARQEANQLTNEAESIVSAPTPTPDPFGGTTPDSILADGQFEAYVGVGNEEELTTDNRQHRDDVIVETASVPDTIFLQEGETVAVDLARIDPSQDFVLWELREQNANAINCEDKTVLLLTCLPSAATGFAEYYPVRPNNCSSQPDWAGYEEAVLADATSNFVNQFAIPPSCSDGTLRLKVLYHSAYVSINGLTDIIRAAAGAGDQVSVVEQNKTAPTPPHFSEFPLFAGNGKVCQVYPGFDDCT